MANIIKRTAPLIFKNFQHSYLKSCYHRNLSISKRLFDGAYDGQGKTTVSILNKEDDKGLMIDAVNQFGFRLNNDTMIVGPIAIFNRAIFSWNIASDEYITKESLELFLHLDPKLDVLVIGLSDQTLYQSKVMKVANEVRKYCNIEVLPCEKGISTFNFLVGEGRIVGAALIPPKHINFTDDDFFETRRKTKQLYEIDMKQQFL